MLLNIFVACPYQFFPLNDYKKVYQDVARTYQVNFKFADEQITNQHILEKITGYIRSHDISLFDITGWNTNVALELGIAVGMNKKYFILLNTHLDGNRDAPSDIRGLERIQYKSNEELEARLSILIKQELPKDSTESIFLSIKSDILKTIDESPGMNIVEIASICNHDKEIVKPVIRNLVQNGEIKSSGQTRAMKYYSKNFDLRTVSKPASLKRKQRA